MSEHTHPHLVAACVQGGHAQRRIHLLLCPLADQDPFQVGQDPVLGDPAHDEGPPGDAQTDAKGGLVGAVPTDVTDEDVGGAVLFHRVVEVTADQGAFAAGSVVGTVFERGSCQEHLRQQATLQTHVLVSTYTGLVQLACVFVCTSVFYGIAQAAGQEGTIDLSLDEVVLGARGDGGQPLVLVVQTGEDDHSC